MGSDLKERAKQILEKIPYITIATVNDSGQPWNTPVYSVHDEKYNFYWISSTNSQHSKNIAENPKIFLVIYDSTVKEGAGEGIYVQATASPIEDELQLNYALSLYFTDKKKESPLSSEFIGSNTRRIYKAVPKKIWINTDEKVGPHHIDGRAEINLFE